jgi:FkbM family methyltransferase
MNPKHITTLGPIPQCKPTIRIEFYLAKEHAMLGPQGKYVLKNSVLSVAAALKIVPCGAHMIFDLKRRLPSVRISTIFDVGANIGQSIRELHGEFPDAAIIAFEPSHDTFSRLKSNTKNIRCVALHNLAISSRKGQARFDNRSPVSEIHALAADQQNADLPLVDITTIDDFCKSNRIEQIDLLKIDTEGHDLEVLRGASQMLAHGSISIIVAECSMEVQSHRLISFFVLQAEMEKLGYGFFGLYGQGAGHLTGSSRIAWANCVYVSKQVEAKTARQAAF